MPFKEHKRQSIRLKAYDYASMGAYFITVCTKDRQCLFGEIVDEQMRLNEFGRIVRDEWIQTGNIRQEISLDQYVIMPNHFHGIVFIINHVGATGRSPLRERFPCGPPNRSLGSLMAGFKSIVTKRINALRKTPLIPVWQRNYYDRIIRNEAELYQLRDYIFHNPLKWDLDKNNPKNH